MKHIELGKKGEALARTYLENKGYTIIDTNVIIDNCEIDIIAIKGSLIIFAEVKTRKNFYYGQPEESVSLAKEEKILNASELYMERENLENEIRFDIIAIILNEEKEEIYHIKDVF